MSSVAPIPAIYPPQLAEHLVTAWRQLDIERCDLPVVADLSAFLEVLYQASFLHEERDPVRCRAILAAPEDWEQGEGPPAGFHVLRFDQPRQFTPQEIRKLSPAVSYHRALIGIHYRPGEGFHIWGIIESGARWVNRIDGGRFHGAPLPPHLVGHIRGPGQLLTSCGYHRLIELEGGRILETGFDPFKSLWLVNYFIPVRLWLMDRLAESQLGGSEVEDGFVRLLAQNVVRRTLSLVRGRGHGGMMIYLPMHLKSPEEFQRWLQPRCSFQQSSATERFTTLVLRSMEQLAAVGHRHGLSSVSWKSYQELEDPQLAEIDESFFEMAHLFADLMSVDGALILSQRFEILGFGAEVLGEIPVHEIYRALDVEALTTQVEPANNSGTRHRAAYRLVSSIPDAVVAVVSQDGATRFVANCEGRVTYWPYLP